MNWEPGDHVKVMSTEFTPRRLRLGDVGEIHVIDNGYVNVIFRDLTMMVWFPVDHLENLDANDEVPL